MATEDHVPRSLSRRESQIVGWLEEEQPALVTVDDLARALDLPPKRAAEIATRLAAKGWLHRARQGAYEPLLASSGGIALPNPWAALAEWTPAHYIGYGSAAYQWNLTPDRPANVQVCVPTGTYSPVRFEDLAITLIPQRAFSSEQTTLALVQGQSVRFSSPEKTVLDSAIRPGRVGGTIPLARILFRASPQVDWNVVVQLAQDHPRGTPGLRRIGALLELLEIGMPAVLLEAIPGDHRFSRAMLDDRGIYGRKGPTLDRWRITVNVPLEAFREEARR